MKINNSVKLILLGALIGPGLTACSMFGGGSKEELASSDEKSEAKTEEAGGGEEAVAGAEDAGINDAAVADAAQAAAGTAGGEMPSSEIPSELTNASPDMAAASNAAPAPTPAASAPSMAAAPGDAKVYYVSANNTNLRASPDAGAQATGTLSKGDPVLVKIEGNWANVVNRGWVELASLSMTPISRAKAARAWN